MKPFLSGKNRIFPQTGIESNHRIISDDFDLSEEFRSLNVNPDEFHLSDKKNLSDPVEIAINTFENHPSVQDIKYFSKPQLLFRRH